MSGQTTKFESSLCQVTVKSGRHLEFEISQKKFVLGFLIRKALKSKNKVRLLKELSEKCKSESKMPEINEISQMSSVKEEFKKPKKNPLTT